MTCPLCWPLPEGAPARPPHEDLDHFYDCDPNGEGSKPWLFEEQGEYVEQMEWIELNGVRVWHRRFRVFMGIEAPDDAGAGA